jgi:hypothetical protein
MPAKVEHWARKPAGRTPLSLRHAGGEVTPPEPTARLLWLLLRLTLSERKFEEIVNQLR